MKKLTNVLDILGAGLVTLGVGVTHAPAGAVVGGLLLLAASWRLTQ